MLKVNHLSVYYGAFHALSDICLSIEQGEIVTLLGGNGAGKTTTINTISGIVNSASGTIEFDGQDITKAPAHKRAAMGIVQVPEGRKLFPMMSVMDNLLVGSYLKSTHGGRKANLDYCFELFPRLYERRDQTANSLSGGEQQMCAIARGLMQQPKLLMLDEPSLGLAPVITEQVFEIIKKINAQGITILLVEQNALAALEVAERGYVVEVGKNVLDGSSDDLLHNEDVKKAYLGI